MCKSLRFWLPRFTFPLLFSWWVKNPHEYEHRLRVSAQRPRAAVISEWPFATLSARLWSNGGVCVDERTGVCVCACTLKPEHSVSSVPSKDADGVSSSRIAETHILTWLLDEKIVNEGCLESGLM